jgi:serum/glucocorticoid-regulated kinase 2
MAPTILDEPDPDLGQQSDGKTEDEDESVATSATKPSEPAQKKVEDEDTVDVFDGYSFKGRHSVLIDDEEERDDGSTQVSEPVESELGDIDTEVEDEASSHRGLKEDRATTPVVHADQAPPTPITPASELEELTPTVLTPVTPSSISEPLPAADVTPTLTPTTPATTAAEDIRAGSVTPPPRVPPTQPVAAKQPRAKREKSGVPALDRFMSSIIDEDDEATAAERDEEEDDWDFVEAPGVEEANGMKTGGSSLFARGVVDRYRLAVFRKSSSSRTTSRDSTMPASPSPLSQSSSPTPSEGKARARRAGGLSLRKSTKQFLRPRSPATYSAVTSKSHPTSRPPGSTSTPRSFSGVAGFLLAPSQSSPLHASEPPSLKSKSSALSKTSGSSDNSLDELRSTSNPTSMPNSPSPSPAGPHKRTMRTSSSEEPERHKNLKKMKTGAEKMFSIFGSPKSQAQPQQ